MKHFKQIIVLIIILSWSCSTDKDDNLLVTINPTFNFTHNWDGLAVTNVDFNIIQFKNANGEDLSIERLRYLISNITFHKSNDETIVIEGYNLVDLTNNSNLSFSPNAEIPIGTYSNVSFTFGFNNEDNYQNYTDLNSASWSVPTMLGGGYHFMQLEGKFIDNTNTETGYAYHSIRAVDNSGLELVFQDTFFEVNLGAITINEDSVLEIKMNIAEWFKNPNQWDLNALHSVLMPNFDAQIMMSENGQNVFSLNEMEL